MASVTQTIPNFLGGVSSQPDDKKLPGQVRQAVNAYPDPTFGLQKRPGLKYLTQLESATTGGTAFDNNDLDNSKWFYMNHGTDEKYIGCIVGNATEADAAIHVWNIAEVDGNGDYVKAAVTYGTNTRQYLNALNHYDYDFLNVVKTGIITNKTKTITAVTDTAFVANKVATIKNHIVDYSAKYEVILTFTGGATHTCTVNTKANDTASNDADTTEFLNTTHILTDLKAGTTTSGAYSGAAGGLHGISGITAEVIGTSLELTGTSAFTLTVIGGKAGNALTVYQDEVNNITELATPSKHDRVIKLVNTTSTDADYFSRFKADNEGNGPGTWTEGRGPGEDKGLNSTTMPHKLVSTSKNNFTFSTIEHDVSDGGISGVFGAPRLVGDSKSNKHPSFVGSTIQQAFYYNNRLGFLTADNVSMGKAADYFNFYYTSAMTTTDDDPIDLSCSSIKDATLHGIIPSAGGLMLFSQNQQFMMYSADGNLSPKTALIRSLSNYKMDSKIDPVDLGNYVSFVSKTHDTAGFTRVFGFAPQGLDQLPRVVDIGRSVAEYVPATITGLHANTQNSFITMWGPTEDKIYFYRTYSDGENELMQCWFNWQLPGKVHYVETDADTLYTVIKTGTSGSARYTVLSATLTQTPEEAIVVTSAGQQVNPHMDFYAKASSVTYDSAGNFSKCFLPYDASISAQLTTYDPVILIAGNASTNFSGATESGFWLAPGAPIGTPAYLKVPGKDLSAQAANVYVGYKYNYDITLPKMYFRKDDAGAMSDYTASLTVARMKFSIGQSSVVGFKLKSKGYKGSTQTWIGDGSTKDFTPTFQVNDKNDVRLKVNGALYIKDDQYIVTDQGNGLVMVSIAPSVSAPAAATTVANVTTPAETVEVYVDNWYVLQPTQDANYYLSDDVPLDTQSIFTVPIHQRSDNYTLRVFSDSPFPVALTSMAWEGTYSPRFYRRV
tara:strand:- start:14507 stop:17353 length:2847 start_codon:yes stop_codon:yes gene_type:complete